MAKDSSTTDSKVPASLGLAKVQDPNGPDVIDANNTGRIGDAREYDAERLAAAAPTQEGYAIGNTAPETRYADLDGNLVTGPTDGEGFRGSVIVAKGDVVSAAVAAQLKG